MVGSANGWTIGLPRFPETDPCADGNFTFAPGRGDDPPVAVDGETVVDQFRATVT